MKALKHFLVDAPETHIDKLGDIIIIDEFDNQEKAKQVFQIHSAPENFTRNIGANDKALIHFNVVTYTLEDGEKIPSKFHVKDDVFYCPIDMVHGIIRECGDYVMLDGWNLISPILKEEEVTESGIIVNLNNDKEKQKKSIMKGRVVATSGNLEIKKDDLVVLSEYSDYSVNIENETFWLVKDNDILFKTKDLSQVE